MATKPFHVTITSPADTDIVAVFPSLDRSDKDVFQSWLLTDHNVDGTHSEATFPQVGVTLSDGSTVVATPTPAASRTAIFRDTDGALKSVSGDVAGNDPINPVGMVSWTAASQSGHLPGLTSFGTGEYTYWLYAAGQAVSRTTFARLFAVIGTTYGSGDGVSTFNVPDIQARQIVGQDGLNGSTLRISVAGGNFDATVLGASGGAQNHTLLVAEMPAHAHTGSGNVSDPTHAHGISFSNAAQNNFGGAGGGGGGGSGNATITIANAATGITVPSLNINNTGGGGSHTILDPTIVLKPIIRV